MLWYLCDISGSVTCISLSSRVPPYPGIARWNMNTLKKKPSRHMPLRIWKYASSSAVVPPTQSQRSRGHLPGVSPLNSKGDCRHVLTGGLWIGASESSFTGQLILGRLRSSFMEWISTEEKGEVYQVSNKMTDKGVRTSHLLCCPWTGTIFHNVLIWVRVRKWFRLFHLWGETLLSWATSLQHPFWPTPTPARDWRTNTAQNYYKP